MRLWWLQLFLYALLDRSRHCVEYIMFFWFMAYKMVYWRNEKMNTDECTDLWEVESGWKKDLMNWILKKWLDEWTDGWNVDIGWMNKGMDRM